MSLKLAEVGSGSRHVSRYVLRIRDFPDPILFWGWVETINSTNFREGSGFLGHVYWVLPKECISGVRESEVWHHASA